MEDVNSNVTCQEKAGEFFFGGGAPFLRATSVAHGSYQARGRIRAVAAGLHHSHTNSGI